MTFAIWNITMLNNELFLSNRRFKKGCFLKKVNFYFFIKLFLHTFCPKRTFCYPTTFFESLITHNRSIFEESYISYGKRQKSCTLIVVLVKCLHLTSPIFNSLAKSNRTFYLPGRKYEEREKKFNFVEWAEVILIYWSWELHYWNNYYNPGICVQTMSSANCKQIKDF